MAPGMKTALSIQVVILAVLVGDVVCDFQQTLFHTNDIHAPVQEIDKYNGVDRKEDTGEASSDAESSLSASDSTELSKLVKIMMMIPEFKGRRDDGVDDDITTKNKEFWNKIVKQFELFGKHDNILLTLIGKVLQKKCYNDRRVGNGGDVGIKVLPRQNIDEMVKKQDEKRDDREDGYLLGKKSQNVREYNTNEQQSRDRVKRHIHQLSGRFGVSRKAGLITREKNSRGNRRGLLSRLSWGNRITLPKKSVKGTGQEQNISGESGANETEIVPVKSRKPPRPNVYPLLGSKTRPVPFSHDDEDDTDDDTDNDDNDEDDIK